MLDVFIVEARFHGIIHVFLGEVVDFLADLFFRPIRITFTIKSRQVLGFHLLFVDGSFKIHLKTEHIAVGNGFADGVGVQQRAENIFGA